MECNVWLITITKFVDQELIPYSSFVFVVVLVAATLFKKDQGSVVSRSEFKQPNESVA